MSTSASDQTMETTAKQVVHQRDLNGYNGFVSYSYLIRKKLVLLIKFC